MGAELRIPLRVDPGEYDLGDAAATIRTVGRRWRWITEGLEHLPDAASVAMEAMAEVLGAAGGRGTSLDELGDPVWRRLADLASDHGPRTRLVDLLGGHDPLLIATEECDRMLSAAARVIAAEVGVRDEGRLVGIHVSDGGVPKASVAVADIDSRGLVGDRQATRAYHGRPFQAVSIYSAERIDALADEGHPVRPGSFGENLLLSDIDWDAMRPGSRLVIRAGEDVGADEADGSDGSVVLEVSAWAPPCRTIAAAFIDGRFGRIDHDEFPGWARAYAWVIRGGTVAVGSRVDVLA